MALALHPLCVWVVRHAQRVDETHEVLSTICSPSDPHITPHGRRQARAVGHAIGVAASTQCTERHTARRKMQRVLIYTSPFLRCRQTATEIHRTLDHYTATGTHSSRNAPVSLPALVRIEPGLGEVMDRDVVRSATLPPPLGAPGPQTRSASRTKCAEDSTNASTTGVSRKSMYESTAYVPCVDYRTLTDTEDTFTAIARLKRTVSNIILRCASDPSLPDHIVLVTHQLGAQMIPALLVGRRDVALLEPAHYCSLSRLTSSDWCTWNTVEVAGIKHLQGL